MVLWIIGGVIAYLLVCLFIASVCGSRRRYPAAPETHENRPQP